MNLTNLLFKLHERGDLTFQQNGDPVFNLTALAAIAKVIQETDAFAILKTAHKNAITSPDRYEQGTELIVEQVQRMDRGKAMVDMIKNNALDAAILAGAKL